MPFSNTGVKRANSVTLRGLEPRRPLAATENHRLPARQVVGHDQFHFRAVLYRAEQLVGERFGTVGTQNSDAQAQRTARPVPSARR